MSALKTAKLPPGRAFVLAKHGVFAPGYEHFVEGPRLIQVRPRVSRPGRRG